MLKIITNNWQIKLVCLLIGLSFWAYVSANTVTLDKFPGGIEIEKRNTPANMVAITDTNTVDIDIVAEKSLWSKISTDSVKAYIDLNNLTEGTHEVPVQLDIAVSGIQINNYTPKTVLVRIEPKISKKIPVNVKIEGSAGDGLVASVPVISPEEVEISGAKSSIDNILEATAVIRLDGETDDINKKVQIVALNAENEKINNITFNPSEVEVNIPIVKAELTKSVGIKVQTTGQVSTGYWISSITTNPAEISIAGTTSVLKTINYLETKPINIEGIDKNITRTVDINVPGGVTLVDQINTISVSIEVNQQTTNKQINPKIVYNNLSSSLKVDSIEPQNVNLNISGSNKIIESASADNIKLNLDLSKYTSEGSYYIDINNNMVEATDGITVLNILPSSIKVNLSKK